VLHRIGRADVVAFLDIDAELLAPRYRAAEQAMALLVRAARLVGPRDRTRPDPRADVPAATRRAPGGAPRRPGTAREDGGGASSRARPPTVQRTRARQWRAAAEWVATLGVASAPDGDDAFLLRAPTWDELGAALASAPRPARARLRIEVDPARR
jgi:primosomal protein N' (replication factor Y)